MNVELGEIDDGSKELHHVKMIKENRRDDTEWCNYNELPMREQLTYRATRMWIYIDMNKRHLLNKNLSIDEYKCVC